MSDRQYNHLYGGRKQLLCVTFFEISDGSNETRTGLPN